MLITVSGLPGSGTTTVSKLLSDHYGLEFISAGEVFRMLAREHDMSLNEFGALAESDPSIDRMIDERQSEIANSRDDIILEGRLAGHMAPQAIRVWIKAPLEVRVDRISTREGYSLDEMMDETTKREASEALRYRQIHGIDINDLSIYDIVIDSDRWDQFAITRVLTTAIDSLCPSV